MIKDQPEICHPSAAVWSSGWRGTPHQHRAERELQDILIVRRCEINHVKLRLLFCAFVSPHVEPGFCPDSGGSPDVEQAEGGRSSWLRGLFSAAEGRYDHPSSHRLSSTFVQFKNNHYASYSTPEEQLCLRIYVNFLNTNHQGINGIVFATLVYFHFFGIKGISVLLLRRVRGLWTVVLLGWGWSHTWSTWWAWSYLSSRSATSQVAERVCSKVFTQQDRQ